MKVVCPQCHLKCTVADEKVPPGGVWAKCPKCGERFFINPNAVKVLLTDGPDDGPSAGRLSRNRETRQFIEKIQKKKGLETGQADYDGSKLVILSVDRPSKHRYYVAGAVILLLGSIWVIHLFDLTRNTAAPAPLPQAGPLAATAYNQEKFREDLITLRRRTISLNRLSQRIDRPGPEVRVYTYLINSLSSGLCSNISELAMKSDNPSSGIEMQARCEGYDSEFLSPVILINWTGRSAVAKISDQRGGLEVELFPSMK